MTGLGSCGTWCRAAIAVLSALLGLAAAPAQSQAGPARYVFEMCDSALPGGGTIGAKYALMPKQEWSATDGCAQDGSLAVHQYGFSPGGKTNWALEIEAPRGGTMESISISGGACLKPGNIAYILGSMWAPSGCGEEVRVLRLPSKFRSFDIDLQCFENCEGGGSVYAKHLATTMIDPVPPTLGMVSGSLFDGGVRRGHQDVKMKAQDTGGGLSRLELLVNHSVAESKTLDCDVAEAANQSVTGTVAVRISPCPAQAEAEWSVDTASEPFREGANTVQVCASDFATLGDPNSSCSAPEQVAVDDSCAESAVAGGDELSAEFGESNAETVTVGYGKGATVAGELDTNAGDPVRGATLCVKVGTLGIDSEPQPVALVRTDANGRFSYPLPAGPDREVMVGYRHDSNQVARRVRYYAHVRPMLSVKPRKLVNGRPIRLEGEIPGPNAGGRVVIVQANVVGSKRWITFRKATTGERGRFHGGYRFSSTTRRTRYRFRALVPTQAGYPWVEGASSPVGVLVRP